MITETNKTCDSQFLSKQSGVLLKVAFPELSQRWQPRYEIGLEFACDQLNSTNHSLLLELSSSASCQHILKMCIRSCTYMDTLPVSCFLPFLGVSSLSIWGIDACQNFICKIWST